MVEDDVEVLSLSDGLLELRGLNANLFAQSCPGCLDIIDFINVQLARVGTELLPNLVLDSDSELFCQVTEGILKGVHVRGGSAVVQPCDTLKTNSSIDDLDLELLS